MIDAGPAKIGIFLEDGLGDRARRADVETGRQTVLDGEAGVLLEQGEIGLKVFGRVCPGVEGGLDELVEIGAEIVEPIIDLSRGALLGRHVLGQRVHGNVAEPEPGQLPDRSFRIVPGRHPLGIGQIVVAAFEPREPGMDDLALLESGRLEREPVLFEQAIKRVEKVRRGGRELARSILGEPQEHPILSGGFAQSVGRGAGGELFVGHGDAQNAFSLLPARPEGLDLRLRGQLAADRLGHGPVHGPPGPGDGQDAHVLQSVGNEGFLAGGEGGAEGAPDQQDSQDRETFCHGRLLAGEPSGARPAEDLF